MFPLSFLPLKYSYFRRGRKKSVTAADRGERERRKGITSKRGREKEN